MNNNMTVVDDLTCRVSILTCTNMTYSSSAVFLLELNICLSQVEYDRLGPERDSERRHNRLQREELIVLKHVEPDLAANWGNFLACGHGQIEFIAHN